MSAPTISFNKFTSGNNLTRNNFSVLNAENNSKDSCCDNTENEILNIKLALEEIKAVITDLYDKVPHEKQIETKVLSRIALEATAEAVAEAVPFAKLGLQAAQGTYDIVKRHLNSRKTFEQLVKELKETLLLYGADGAGVGKPMSKEFYEEVVQFVQKEPITMEDIQKFEGNVTAEILRRRPSFTELRGKIQAITRLFKRSFTRNAKNSRRNNNKTRRARRGPQRR